MTVSMGVRNAKTYTMRELSQRTAQIIDEINKTERSAVITKHGHFVALIVPLENAEVERIVLSGPLAEDLQARTMEADKTGAQTFSSDEVAEMLRKHHAE